MVRFFVGLDLGQASDYTALAVLERSSERIYDVRKLERARGTPYPEIVDKVTDIMQSSMMEDDAALVVDQTGVGAPVVDLFRQAGLQPIGVLIHGGDKVTHEGGSWRVPKRDLVGVLMVLMQNKRLRVAWKLRLASILAGEMLNFKIKFDPRTAHDSYSAWRDAEHDDLVLATALAAWWAEREPEPCTWTPPLTGDYGPPPIDPGLDEIFGSSSKQSYKEYVNSW